MVIRIYDSNHSYDFSKGIGKGGSSKFVTPRTPVKAKAVPSPRFRQHNVRGGKGINYAKGINSPTSSPKHTKKTKHIFLQNIPTVKDETSYRSIDERTELDVSHFLESDSPSDTCVKEYENLVCVESLRTFDGILPLFLTRLLLGFTKIKKDLFFNMLQELKRQKQGNKESSLNLTAKAVRDNWQGDYGITLFCPLDESTFQPMPQNRSPILKHRQTRSESPATIATLIR